MSERPSRVRIGGVNYAVIWEGSEWFRSANATAQYDCVKQTIRVFDEGSPAMLASRFVHEVCHGLLFWHSYEEPDRTITGEDVCNVGGYELTDFWISNPHAFKWYVQCLKEEAHNSSGG